MRYVIAWIIAWILVLAVAIGTYRCARAADDWTTGDTVRAGVAAGLTVVDCLQTHTIARNPDIWYEKNPILGPHPSVGRVNNLCALALVAQIGGAYLLPKPYREIMQYIVIGAEASAVSHNYHVGIRISW